MALPIQVLVIEDSAADAEAMIMRLREDGFEPDWRRVSTIGELLSRLTPSVDVILSDYRLGAFTATDVLRALKEAKNDVPVVVVSGILGDEGAVDLLQDGASDYVLKDRTARLAPAVRRAMEARALRSLRLEAESRLQQNEELLRSVLQSIEDVVWSIKLPSKVLMFVNPAAERLFGRPVDKLIADPGAWREAVHPEDVGIFDASYGQAMRWGFSEAEYRIARPDGSARRCRSRMWITFEDSQPIRAEGILADITPAGPESPGPPRGALVTPARPPVVSETAPTTPKQGPGEAGPEGSQRRV